MMGKKWIIFMYAYKLQVLVSMLLFTMTISYKRAREL